MATISNEIISWLKSLKGWQTELAYRILTQESLTNNDYSEIIDMLQKGANFTDKEFPNIGLKASSATGDPIRLKSLESITGIEKLAPKNPLSFELGNLIIVYGNNGSGKSGITRILKKVCGKPNAKQLKANIFKEPSTPGKCVIKYFKGDEEIETNWQINGSTVEDLAVIDIYDTDTGASYVKDSKSISYTPKAIELFEALSKAYGRINEILTCEKDALIKKLPTLPSTYTQTKAALLYNGLTDKHTETDLNYIAWTEEKSKELDVLKERLRLIDPVIAAKEKRKNKIEAQNILTQLDAAAGKVTLSAYAKIKVLREDAVHKRKIAKESVLAFENQNQLSGVGTPTWNALWEAARAYSVTEAYGKYDFPYIDGDARCVLCHQPLNIDAKERLKTFNSFVEGMIENSARIAERLYNEAITSLPKSIDDTDISTKCTAAGLDEHWFEQFKNVWHFIFRFKIS